jgi:hypothetical protein
MTTPFARTCSTLAAVAVSILFTAAPARAQGTPPATPQAALDALEAANAKGDARAALALITPDGQKRLARDTVMNGLMMLAFMDPDDPSPMGPKPTGADVAKRREAYKAVKTSITAALKPSGLDAAIGQPLMPAEKIVDAKMGAVDPGALVPAIMDAVVKAAPAFGMKGTPPMMKLQPFTSLKVDGDHATVKSGPRTMKIDKVGGKWLIDAPLPELQDPPQ